MKITYAALLGLAAATIVAGPASAAVLYDSGPAQGSGGAYSFSGGNVVADSFTLTADSTITSISFSVLNQTGAAMGSVDWGISTGVDWSHGTVSAVSATDIGHTSWGWLMQTYTFSVADLGLTAGTYYLNLAAPSGGFYWDLGTGGSTVFVTGPQGTGGVPYTNSFQIYGDAAAAAPAPTPEPASWAMMVGGFGLAGGVLRRTRRQAVVRLA